MKNVVLPIIALSLMMCTSVCFAGELDFDVMGVSYHFHKSGAYKDAPNKLDDAARWVFNPGLAVGYDFRKDIHTEGISPIVHAGFFQNCANFPFFFAGGGARYRKYIYHKLYWEANVMAVMTYGNDWDHKAYKFSPSPYANVGLGYDFGNRIVTFSLSYVPKDSGNNITSGTDMLFLNMSVGF